MKVSEVKHMIENGGDEIHQEHIDVLFKRIDDAEKIFKRIKLISNNNDMHRDFSVIHDLAGVFLDGEK